MITTKRTLLSVKNKTHCPSTSFFSPVGTDKEKELYG